MSMFVPLQAMQVLHHTRLLVQAQFRLTRLAMITITTFKVLLNGRSFQQFAIFLAEGLHSSLDTAVYATVCREAFHV